MVVVSDAKTQRPALVALVQRTVPLLVDHDIVQLPFRVFAEVWCLSADLEEITSAEKFEVVTSFDHAERVLAEMGTFGVEYGSYYRAPSLKMDPPLPKTEDGEEMRVPTVREYWYRVRADGPLVAPSEFKEGDADSNFPDTHLMQLKEAGELYTINCSYWCRDANVQQDMTMLLVSPPLEEESSVKLHVRIERFTYDPARQAKIDKALAARERRRLRALPTIRELSILLRSLGRFKMTTDTGSTDSYFSVVAQVFHNHCRPTGKEPTFLALRLLMDMQDKLGNPWEKHGNGFSPPCVRRILAKKPMLVAHKDPFWKELVEWLELAQARQGWGEEPAEDV